MQVDPDATPAAGDAIEHRPPEVPAALGHAALAVDAEREPADRRALLQERADRIPTVRGVRLGRESLDRVLGVRAVDPLVGVGPQTELEVEAAGHRLLRDEAERREVALALLVGELRHAHVVPGDRYEERVREVQVRVRYVAVVVVAEAERQAEAVEALRDQHRQVATPELLVVEPALVLDLAAEQPRHAADRVGGTPDDGCLETERAERIGRVLDAVGELQHRVGQPPGVRPLRRDAGLGRGAAGHEGERFGPLGDPNVSGDVRVSAACEVHDGPVRAHELRSIDDTGHPSECGERGAQLVDRPRDGWRSDDGTARVSDDGQSVCSRPHGRMITFPQRARRRRGEVWS